MLHAPVISTATTIPTSFKAKNTNPIPSFSLITPPCTHHHPNFPTFSSGFGLEPPHCLPQPPTFGFQPRPVEKKTLLQCRCSYMVRILSKWKWWKKEEESILNHTDPLPLPMTYPDSAPLPKEQIQKIANCNPQVEDCKPLVYQWTGECKRCQGTGLVSFYRKNGHEVISKCIACLGIGYVQNITQRGSMDMMEELDEPD